MREEKQRKEQKVLSKEELESKSDFYVPSKNERLLLDKILFLVSDELKKQNLFGQVKWSNEKKSFIRIPYLRESKLEVITRLKTISIPVIIENVDTDNNNIDFSFSINKKSIKKSIENFKITHGYLKENINMPKIMFSKDNSMIASKNNDCFVGNNKRNFKRNFNNNNNNSNQDNQKQDDDMRWLYDYEYALEEKE